MSQILARFTPEELSTYLTTRCHFDPDTVQDVIVKYLEAGPETIRHPKSWGYRGARNLQAEQYRHKGNDTLPLVDNLLTDPAPSPERVTQAREELDRYAANPTVTTRAKGRGKPGLNRTGQPLTRPKKWGFKKDYQVLKEAR